MPESPEVQALAEFLDERLTSRRITRVEVDEFRAIKTRDRPPASLEGATVTGVRRFGKHLSVSTDAGALVISFGRAGWARWNGEAAPGGAPVIARIELDDDMLDLTDAGQWLSLALHVVDDPLDVPAIAGLGPDPASDGFTLERFDAVVAGRRKQLKALLQEQESFAGIGNAYSDEILHEARLSPVAHASALDEVGRDALFAATTGVVRAAIAARRGIPPHALKAAKVAAMQVHGRGGAPCPRCGDAVRDHSTSSTSWQYCATCQTAGIPLE
ncbi:DNA-formamidopyrimidine glycosylase family protein [Microbacterium fluvii]|uniref:DNA-formamidopyrimidine glycosylase family protein n=1 Tax=Microbacterium fluvii TaxID=415215 RepID=A0ABW2HC45_9MICO|nr:DNA-formamidopyrimidine glycosylase family protein [Microbacterium fluvii]MCU4672291.1 Fpg/Nei family DNA glycosylase [Microbacterium fluvii]